MGTEQFVTTSADELLERIGAAHRRFAALAADVPDDLGIAGGWTAADVVAHLVNVINRYNDFAPNRLAADPRGVDAVNERELAPLRGRSVTETIVLLDGEMVRFNEGCGPARGGQLSSPMPFHAGASIDLQAGLTNVLAEFVVHGADVAEGAGRPLAIEDRDALLICGLVTQVMPHYVRADNVETARIRIEVPGAPPWTISVDGPNGSGGPASPDDSADVVVRGDATAVVLAAYGRESRLDGDPDAEFSFQRYFEAP